VDAGGTCNADSECVYTQGRYAPPPCKFITDAKTATSLAAIDQRMKAAGCPEIRAFCPHIMKTPQCVQGKCG
jgi:hypothetical protein